MPDYTLKVEGPRPTTRPSAPMTTAALSCSPSTSLEADYGDEGDPALLQASAKLTSNGGSHFDGTVAQMLDRQDA